MFTVWCDECGGYMLQNATVVAAHAYADKHYEWTGHMVYADNDE